MGLSPLVAVVALAVLFLAVALLWWLRYNENKTVARTVSTNPHPYLGRRLANNIYRVPLSRNFLYQTPPPTFSKAVRLPPPPTNLSIISITVEEIPPPTYEQYLQTQEKHSHVVPAVLPS